MGEKRICRLCGGEIVKQKGQQQKIYEQELREGAHQNCVLRYRIIVQQHKISDRDYLNALGDALLSRFPSLKREPSFVEYEERQEETKEAIYKAFPYIKEMDEKEEAKKREEEKEESVVVKKEEEAEKHE